MRFDFSKIRFLYQLPFFLLGGLFLLMCNTTETIKEGHLNLVLPDSLTVEYGKYDTLQINILSSDGKVLIANAYIGPFH
jgi:hypothetical protein